MIELGLAEPWEAPERPVVGRGTVRVVAVVVSLVLLGLLGGGGLPESREPVFRLSGSIHEAALLRDTLVVMTTQPARLRGVRMPDGRPRWSRDLSSDLVFMSVQGDRLFVTEYDRLGEAPGRTRVLDGRSGRELWSRDALWIVARAGERLVRARVLEPDGFVGSAGEPPAEPRIELSGLAAGTGAVLWSEILPAGTAIAESTDSGGYGRPRRGGLDSFAATADSVGSPLPEALGNATRLYDLGPDGVLRTRDPATGAVVGSVRLGVPPGPDLTIVGRVAVVRQSDGAIWASDLAGGLALWRRPADRSADFVSSCGDAVCLVASNRTLLLDPVTGVQQYELLATNTAYRTNGRIVSVDHAGLLIRVIDPATGRRVSELAGWSAVGMYAGARLIAARGGYDGPVRIAVVDLLTGRQLMIAQAGRGFFLPNCRGAGDRLLCWNGSGLQVWSVDL